MIFHWRGSPYPTSCLHVLLFQAIQWIKQELAARQLFFLYQITNPEQTVLLPWSAFLQRRLAKTPNEPKWYKHLRNNLTEPPSLALLQQFQSLTSQPQAIVAVPSTTTLSLHTSTGAISVPSIPQNLPLPSLILTSSGRFLLATSQTPTGTTSLLAGPHLIPTLTTPTHLHLQRCSGTLRHPSCGFRTHSQSPCAELLIPSQQGTPLPFQLTSPTTFMTPTLPHTLTTWLAHYHSPIPSLKSTDALFWHLLRQHLLQPPSPRLPLTVTPSLVYSDGSLLHQDSPSAKAGYGLVISRHNITQATAIGGNQSIYKAEVQGAFTGIAHHSPPDLVQVHLDNQGAVSKYHFSFSPSSDLTVRQRIRCTKSVLFESMRTLLTHTSIQASLQWIKGHQDPLADPNNPHTPLQLQTDTLAKQGATLPSPTDPLFPPGSFPFVLTFQKTRIEHDPTQALQAYELIQAHLQVQNLPSAILLRNPLLDLSCWQHSFHITPSSQLHYIPAPFA
mmetsp:Transcript_1077/g.1648  ORF Transcript_1077/g.1648 Transcript_1077/m.1648 type:complete len:502 (-) Transcript_1077:235-1740(-)